MVWDDDGVLLLEKKKKAKLRLNEIRKREQKENGEEEKYFWTNKNRIDRKRVGQGKRADMGGRRITKKKQTNITWYS